MLLDLAAASLIAVGSLKGDTLGASVSILMIGSGVLGLFWNIFVRPISAGGAIARGLAVAVGLLISAPLMSGFITSLLSCTPSDLRSVLAVTLRREIHSSNHCIRRIC